MKLPFLNRLVAASRRDVKIFLIGFNKTGTTTIHKFLRANHIASAHFRARERIIALEMSRNIGRHEDVLHGISGFTAYSDFTFATADVWLEGSKYFATMHAHYPRAYFILNDRDVDTWVESRSGHDNLMERAMAFHGGATVENVKAIWRAEFEAHRSAVLSHFADNPRFLRFDIGKDDPSAIVNLLAPDFSLRASRFGWKNRGQAGEKS